MSRARKSRLFIGQPSCQFTRSDLFDVIPDVRERNKCDEEDVGQRFCFIPNGLVEHPQSHNRLDQHNRFDDDCCSSEFVVQGMLERVEEDHRQPEGDGYNRQANPHDAFHDMPLIWA
jgi:hypothetical protein